MTITYIEFMPVAEAIALQPFPGDVLVSITEPDCTPKPIFQDGWKDIVRLEFWDIEAIKDGIFYPINDAQANEIADFIRRHHEGREDVRLMVHCRAGISRSVRAPSTPRYRTESASGKLGPSKTLRRGQNGDEISKLG